MGGDIKYTCSNGSWSKGSGSCKASCTAGYISNGYWKNNANNANVSGTTLAHGTVVSMACNSGYTLIGSSVATCNDGNWNFSSSNGRCRKNGPVYFYYTGSSQTFNPSNYGLISGDVITLEVWGAQGGGNNGGKGGYSKGQYKYTSGSITVWVGGRGGNPDGDYKGGRGGWNNGGNAGIGCGGTHGTGGGGGGRTNIDLNGTSLIIAGGGGGVSESEDCGGNGSGNNDSGSNGCGDYKGYGGTNTSGGKGGYECAGRGDGSKNSGGNGSIYKADSKGNYYWDGCCRGSEGYYCGGGGGGGYYGGGAGDYADGNKKDGGGGGGSGFCGNGAYNCGGSNGTNKGNGYAKISW